jgi:dTMP kinase
VFTARGIFITLEGGEGAGKSTLARALAARLTASGKTVVVTREPGGSLKAERIREVILSGEVKPYGPFAEAMMFYAARADHLAATIRPALSRGDWVICDRFSDSTRAYQGSLGRINRTALAALERAVLDGTAPDLTIILDIPPEIGMERANLRRGQGKADRFEAEAIGFHRRLRQAFLDIAAAMPQRCIVIDASGTPVDVEVLAWEAIESRYPGLGQGEVAATS